MDLGLSGLRLQFTALVRGCSEPLQPPELVLGIPVFIRVLLLQEDGLSMDFYVTFWRLSLQETARTVAQTGIANMIRKLRFRTFLSPPRATRKC